jgi:hypothetical protein
VAWRGAARHGVVLCCVEWRCIVFVDRVSARSTHCTHPPPKTHTHTHLTHARLGVLRPPRRHTARCQVHPARARVPGAEAVPVHVHQLKPQ